MKNKHLNSTVCQNVNKGYLSLDCRSVEIVFSFFFFFNSDFSTMICIIKIDSEKSNTENLLFLRFIHALPLLWCPYRFKKRKVGTN